MFVIKKDAKCLIDANVNKIKYSIKKGFQSENNNLTLSVTGGKSEILIAGTKKSSAKKIEFSVYKTKNIYKVSKPWGYELWLNGRHKDYAFKKIFLKRGYKTSLQYHKYKEETIFLYSGIGTLHFSAKNSIKN